jgi:hypothetical protein
MKKLAALGLVASLLTALALTSRAADEATPRDRLARFRQDRRLLEMLVDSGLKLAAQDDPLERAETCNTLADHLAQEMGRAATGKDRARALDLGRNLQTLLVRGIAPNLALAYQGADTPPVKETRRVGEEVEKALAPALQELEQLPDQQSPDMRDALQGLSRGRAEVEKAAAGKGSSHGRSRGKQEKGRGR